MRTFAKKWECPICGTVATDPTGFKNSNGKQHSEHYYNRHAIYDCLKLNEHKDVICHPNTKDNLLLLEPVSRRHEMMKEFIELKSLRH